MRKRSCPALVLIGYSLILIAVVVFKAPMRVASWMRPVRKERGEETRPGRGRGDPSRFGGEESRPGRRTLPDTRLSTNRFAPLHANYVPFKTILPQLRGEPRWSNALMNLIANTVLFAPVGVLALLVDPKMSWLKALVLAVAAGATMEMMEGIFRLGVVDVDDLILNALGVMGGYGIGRVWERRKKALVA